MADLVLSTLLNALVGNLASGALREIKLLWGVRHELELLSRTLKTIRAMIGDAEEKLVKTKEEIDWLQRLQEIAYEAEDVLDEFASEAGLRKLEEENQRGKLKRVRVFSRSFAPSEIKFHRRMALRIKNIRERFGIIQNERIGIYHGERLIDGSWAIIERRKFGSLMDNTRFFGRDNDIEKVVGMLMSEDIGEKNITVIPIIGMGGLGKTTLAQRVYNEEAVRKHFEVMGWVSVSEDSSVVRITKELIESTKGSSAPRSSNIDLIQRELQAFLMNKRFLIVLDDIWEESPTFWEQLSLPLNVGSKGSKLVVTTRSKKVSSIVGTVQSYPLEGLPFEACWSLFTCWAFPLGDMDAHPELMPIGKRIVEKCQGLPLAVKALGGLLSSKRSENVWKTIMTSSIWNSGSKEKEVLPALHLSYHHLPANLKQCFAFCAIYPKGYEFSQETLVSLAQIWAVSGFIHADAEMPRIEELNYDLFDELLLRSFFQYSHQDVNGEAVYKMHDLMHDLAESVSRDECFCLEGNTNGRIPARPRHSLLICGEKTDFSALRKLETLRTLSLMKQHLWDRQWSVNIPEDLLTRLKFLRVLDLSHVPIKNLPTTLSGLKHLRYLDLSETSIQRLPDSIGALYNLQILKFDYCAHLVEFPKTINTLVNLKHLTFEMPLETMYEGLVMPQGIGKLTNLQCLTRFIVNRGKGCSLKELHSMNELGGVLEISNLENVACVEEAEEANLKSKQHISSVVLRWTPGRWCEYDEQVLEALTPHCDLKELSVCYYQGDKLASWMGNQSFTNLRNIYISNCERCNTLPPLGQLPFLESLEAYYLPRLVLLGREFYGNGKFPSLKTLSFRHLQHLEKWHEAQEGDMPQLVTLMLQDCYQLKEFPLLPPSLRRLEISGCSRVAMRCRHGSEDWHKIEHIPCIWVHGEYVQGGD